MTSKLPCAFKKQQGSQLGVTPPHTLLALLSAAISLISASRAALRTSLICNPTAATAAAAAATAHCQVTAFKLASTALPSQHTPKQQADCLLQCMQSVVAVHQHHQHPLCRMESLSMHTTKLLPAGPSHDPPPKKQLPPLPTPPMNHPHLLVRLCLTALHKVCHHVAVLLLQERRQSRPLGGATGGRIIRRHCTRHLTLHINPALVQPSSLQGHTHHTQHTSHMHDTTGLTACNQHTNHSNKRLQLPMHCNQP